MVLKKPIPISEISVHTNEHGVARLNHIADARLHRCGSRAADWDREVILRLEGISQERFDVFHELKEVGIQMPNLRQPHLRKDCTRRRVQVRDT